MDLLNLFMNYVAGPLVSAVVTSKPFLYYAAITSLYVLVFWLCWLIFNVLFQRLQTRTGWRALVVKVMFYAGIPFAALVDIVFNWFPLFAPLLFLEWPHESTLSMRMTRYVSRRDVGQKGGAGFVDYGYRTPMAVWISYHLVEPLQPGHIGLAKYGYPEPKPLIDKIMACKWVKRLLP